MAAGCAFPKPSASTARDAPLGEGLVVRGKGDKDRLVPVLRIVREAVNRYLELCPHVLAADGPLFVGIRGKRLNPRIIQGHLQTLRGALGLPETADAARLAPLLRHPSLGRRW